jgi:hypothetical protein
MSRKPFHRSDFTGSEGPGLAKLRAARREGWADQPRKMLEKRATGLALIKEMMRRGLWIDAILAAAKFPDLGDQAEAIQRGREAIMRPDFMRQLKRDPEAAIEAAKAALLERWPL